MAREVGAGFKVGLIVPTWTTRQLRWQDVLDVAKEAVAAGFGALWVTDHLQLPSTNAELKKRAGVNDVDEGGEELEGYLECFTTLTALAVAIPDVELGTLVACTGYRNPDLLAKIADALDEVSGGRFVLGLGAGDSAGEHRTLGLPTDSPVGRFEEALHVIRTLLRKGGIDHSGPFYSAREVTLIPRGPRLHGPPILIGTLNPRPRMRRLVTQYADVWNAWLGYTDASPSAAQFQIEQIEEACREHGREPASLVKTTAVRANIPGSGYRPRPDEKPLSGSPEEMAATLAGHADLGITQVQVALTMGGREGVRAFAPVIRALGG